MTTKIKRRKAREKWLSDKRHSRATSFRGTPPSNASIGLSDVNPDGQHDAVDKQPVGLLGTAERRQHCAAEAENRGVLDAWARLIV